MSLPQQELNLDTPAVVIDTAQVKRNIDAFQTYCDEHGMTVRPHIKTHKLPQFAHWQLEAGAVGITCQKISEAEVMADAGIEDILITYNILGAIKLQRLKYLAQKLSKLAVVADNSTVVEGLAKAFEDSDGLLKVWVECNTGAQRCGVEQPHQVVALAQQIEASKGLTFAGLMTYPPAKGHAKVMQFMTAAKVALNQVGLPCPAITSGGTPDLWQACSLDIINEYRPGTYIYNDRSLVEYGTCSWQDCALTVVATVVSANADGRAIIDAGSKVLSSDLLGLQGHGYVIGHPQVTISGLSEEHGHLVWPTLDQPFQVGQQLRIIPNHACVVSNLVGRVWLYQNGELDLTEVAARGKVV